MKGNKYLQKIGKDSRMSDCSRTRRRKKPRQNQNGYEKVVESLWERSLGNRILCLATLTKMEMGCLNF